MRGAIVMENFVTLKNFSEVNEKELKKVVGGKKPDLLKCLAGGGMAVSGMLAGGPVGYFAGAAVGFASFCR